MTAHRAAAQRIRSAIVLVVMLHGPVTGQLAPAAQTKPTAPPRDPITAAPTATAAIRGRIVQADTGAPLRRVQVTLTGDRNLRRQVTTDADGRYEFSGLPAGRFTVTAAKGGFLALQYGQRRPFEPGRPVAVTATEVLDDVNLALPRGSVIVGRVTDERGEPVVGAEVRVERYQYNAEGQRRLTLSPPVRVTNDLGEFRAFDLTPGEYVVSATVRQMPLPPGQAAAIGPVEGYLPTYYPGTPGEATAHSISVALAQQTAVEFALVRGRLSRVAGTILDSTGRPAAGASLMLATVASSSIGASGRGAGTVAADGSFSIGNITPGQHFIQVALLPRPGAATAAEVANFPIAVTGEDMAGLQIITGSGATAAGRVEWQGSAPRTGGPSAKPLRIVTSAADGRPALIGLIGAVDTAASGTVERDDTFRVGGLMGAVRFAVEGVPPQWMLKAVIVNGADVTDTGIDATSLGASSPVRVVLTDRVTEVSGSVSNARGERVSDYVVVVLPEEPVAPPVAPRYTRAVRPDQSGSFRLRALPPGRYRAIAVDALEQGTEWDPAFQAAVREASRRFTLADGQALSLDLDLLR